MCRAPKQKYVLKKGRICKQFIAKEMHVETSLQIIISCHFLELVTASVVCFSQLHSTTFVLLTYDQYFEEANKGKFHDKKYGGLCIHNSNDYA